MKELLFYLKLNPHRRANCHGPLIFQPLLKHLVWGNRLLGERLGKPLPDAQPYGESWEVSDHASHASVVANPPLAGTSLRDLMTKHRRELLGQAAPRHELFPWLVKFLDCHDWLSVQVHPNDEQAKKWRPGERGKTEAWFILEALPGSRIYAGLLPGVDEKSLRAALAAGTVAHCLHSFEPQAGDCVFLPAGTVHAVGGGVLLVEIQQTSDATFRLFDWNRVDAQGNSRQLHVEEALACIDWKAGPVQPIRSATLDIDLAGAAVAQLLVDCRYFRLEIWRQTQPFQLGGMGRLQLFVPLHGKGDLALAGGLMSLCLGQTWVLPASMAKLECKPDGALAYLLCDLPD